MAAVAAAESAANRLTHQAADQKNRGEESGERLGPKCAGGRVAGAEQGTAEIMAGLGHQRGGLAGTRKTHAKLDSSDLRCLFAAQPRGVWRRTKNKQRANNLKTHQICF